MGLSKAAEKVLLFLFIQAHGLPEWAAGDDPKTSQMKVFSRLTDLSDMDTAAAFAEAEDAGMIGTQE